MDAGKIITSMTVMIIIIFVFMSFILMILPMKTKLALDNICREQQWIASRDMGLSTEQLELFSQKLSEQGLTAINIKCPAQGVLNRYEESTMSIEGKVICKIPNGFLNFEMTDLKYSYKGSLLGRRILN